MKVDFYDLYIALCRDIEISPSEAAKLMGFNMEEQTYNTDRQNTYKNGALFYCALFVSYTIAAV